MQPLREPRHDPHLVCVVERPPNMRVIDGAAELGGLFHALCVAWSPRHEVGPDQLRLRQLLARPDGVRDVTYGTAPDVEGDTAALYVAKSRGIQASA